MTGTEMASMPAKAESEGPRVLGLRPDRMPRPIEKAAIILTAIGPELAAGFLRDLSEDDMNRFAQTLCGIGTVPQEVLDAVVVEFLEALTTGPELKGGAKTARSLLSAIMDDSEVSSLLGGRGESLRSVWDRVNDAPIDPLAGFVEAEHPQTAAYILSKLSSEIAANILEELDDEMAKSIVLRLARVPTLDPTINKVILSAIERDFLPGIQRRLSKGRPTDLIATLLNNVSTQPREVFLRHLEEQVPDLAREVEKTMFTFDDISVRLNGRDVAVVTRDISEEELLKALKFGEMQESVAVSFIMNNMPRRLCERVAEDLSALEGVSRKEGEAAQLALTKAIQTRVREGTITLLDREVDEA